VGFEKNSPGGMIQPGAKYLFYESSDAQLDTQNDILKCFDDFAQVVDVLGIVLLGDREA
jgi:hypothetical protein